jgi:glycosyltransferase involved in cell wall biosynthesis
MSSSTTYPATQIRCSPELNVTRLRIGLDLRLHAYAPGGISRYARRLARALVDLIPPEDVTLIEHRREGEPLALAGAGTYRAWTPPHHAWERWALGVELLPLGLDLLHSTDFIPPAWGARRRVITIHDLTFLHYPDYLTADAQRYYNDQIVWAAAQADAILVDSAATRRDLHTLLDVPLEWVTVAHLAAGARFRPLPAQEIATTVARYELEPGYLLFVGVWEPRKNLPGLLEALALLRDRGVTAPLVIAGRPGWLYEEIFDRVAALHLTSQVRFIEHLPVADLVGLYNGARLLVMPSFYEGFGLPALEAMQCGTPTVVSDRASLPEVVGEAGLLVDPDDPTAIAEACWRLLNDDANHARLRAAGLAQAERFTWRATAERTLEAYQSAMARA